MDAIDIRTNERSFLLEFIEVYKSLPALWNSKSKAYFNKDLKAYQYEILLEKYQEFYPKATINMMKRKINTLRSNYRKTLRKLNTTNLIGNNDADADEPTLWYFNEMSFLQHIDNSDSVNNTLECKNDNLPNQHNIPARLERRLKRLRQKTFGEESKPNRTPQRSYNSLTVDESLIKAKSPWNTDTHDYDALQFSTVDDEKLNDELVAKEKNTNRTDHFTVVANQREPQFKEAYSILADVWAYEYSQLETDQQVLARTMFAEILCQGYFKKLNNTMVTKIHKILAEDNCCNSSSNI